MVAWIAAVTGQRRGDKRMSPRYILEEVSAPGEELDINYNGMSGTGEEEGRQGCSRTDSCVGPMAPRRLEWNMLVGRIHFLKHCLGEKPLSPEVKKETIAFVKQEPSNVK